MPFVCLLFVVVVVVVLVLVFISISNALNFAQELGGFFQQIFDLIFLFPKKPRFYGILLVLFKFP